jgi:hypothetical protein
MPPATPLPHPAAPALLARLDAALVAAAAAAAAATVRQVNEKRAGEGFCGRRGVRVASPLILLSHGTPSPPHTQAEDASKKRAVAQGVDYDAFCEMVRA